MRPGILRAAPAASAATIAWLALCWLSSAAAQPAAPSAAAPAPQDTTTPAAAPPAKTPAAPSDDDCLDCHATGRKGAAKVTAKDLAQSAHHGQRCVDCHSSISELPHAKTLPKVDCDACHRRIAHQISRGMHAAGAHPGAAPTATRPPACVDCHGSHAMLPAADAAFHAVISQRCARCHEPAYAGYMQTVHGQAAALGLKTAPACSDCHQSHAARPASDPLSSVSAANLADTCGACHKGADVKLTGFDPHPQPRNARHSRPVYYAHIGMVVLLAGVFGFFGLHTLLWLQRSVIGRLRGELPRKPHPQPGEPYIRRFRPIDSALHITLVVSFMALALTGLPLMYSNTPWAHVLINLFGGPHTARVIHRVNAAITFGFFGFHLCHLAYRYLVKGMRFRIFGVDSLVPNWQDILDILRNFRWFLYLGPRPQVDRWSYWEKFDYWAVFWGTAIIGSSGLFMVAPVLFSHVLPGVAFNVAQVLHGEEAILATGFIFTFHFFHNHWRPEKFPIDISIFIGRLSLARFKEEHPLQYARLMAEGRLEELKVPPPSRAAVVAATIFGYSVIVTGVVLIVLVVLAPAA